MKLHKVLGIISILGFLGIILDASLRVDITPWIQSILFLLIGMALLTAGGYRLFFDYFKDGLTFSEINKLITIAIGFLSCLIGILLIFEVDLSAFAGVKIIVSFIAITVIAYETWGRKR